MPQEAQRAHPGRFTENVKDNVLPTTIFRDKPIARRVIVKEKLAKLYEVHDSMPVRLDQSGNWVQAHRRT